MVRLELADFDADDDTLAAAKPRGAMRWIGKSTTIHISLAGLTPTEFVTSLNTGITRTNPSS
jgi:hypothetical protein